MMQEYDKPGLVNIGVGADICIRDLASLVADIVEFDGRVVWDSSKPDGTPRKLLDCSKISDLGWRPRVSLGDGVKLIYEWWLRNRTWRA